jgi:hypothetical protein
MAARLPDLPWMKPLPQIRYPHMLSLDADVWTRFLELALVPIELVAYDVHVGTPMPVPAELGPMGQRIADGVSRKRIDAVYLVTGTLHVVEIKPYGNHAALGQIEIYLPLFRESYPYAGPTVGEILCVEADPDIIRIAAGKGVRVIETDPPPRENR